MVRAAQGFFPTLPLISTTTMQGRSYSRLMDRETFKEWNDKYQRHLYLNQDRAQWLQMTYCPPVCVCMCGHMCTCVCIFKCCVLKTDNRFVFMYIRGISDIYHKAYYLPSYSSGLML